MGRLTRIGGDHLATPPELELAPGLVIGRAPPAGGFAIDELSMSRTHAAVGWSEGWTIRDLDTSNGTHVDGRRLERGEQAPLREGAVVVFGNGPRWKVTSDAPPRS